MWEIPVERSIMAINPNTSVPNKALDLMAAVAGGDAAIEDIAGQLKRDGIDSVEAVLSMLRKGAIEHKSNARDVTKPINLKDQRNTTPREIVSRIVQRVPTVPFILNGTMYDPKDIRRFDGQELHFVPAPAGDHMLVVDDRALITTWRQLAYLEQYRSVGASPASNGHPPTLESLRHGSARNVAITIFYPHIGFQDWGIFLEKNRGYWDLTEVCDGLFCESDWNDKISSVYMYGTQVTVLHEHIHWTGQTFTLFGSMSSLVEFGWNDRASSLETW
jgi:hypothetical protein